MIHTIHESRWYSVGQIELAKRVAAAIGRSGSTFVLCEEPDFS